MTKPGNNAAEIIERFGGQSELARLLGHTSPSTVQGWRQRGRIPSWQIPLVLDAAGRAGVKLELADFFQAGPEQ